MKIRPVQYFSKEYLDRCKTMTPLQILEFEEDFQKLIALQQLNETPIKIIRTAKQEEASHDRDTETT